MRWVGDIRLHAVIAALMMTWLIADIFVDSAGRTSAAERHPPLAMVTSDVLAVIAVMCLGAAALSHHLVLTAPRDWLTSLDAGVASLDAGPLSFDEVRNRNYRRGIRIWLHTSLAAVTVFLIVSVSCLGISPLPFDSSATPAAAYDESLRRVISCIILYQGIVAVVVTMAAHDRRHLILCARACCRLGSIPNSSDLEATEPLAAGSSPIGARADDLYTVSSSPPTGGAAAVEASAVIVSDSVVTVHTTLHQPSSTLKPLIAPRPVPIAIAALVSLGSTGPITIELPSRPTS